MTTQKLPTRILLCALFCVCGFVGNRFNVHLFFNVDFLIGSVFSMLAIGLLGPACGVITAFAAGICTYFLWNHPWAIVIFTGEAAVVSWLYSKRKGNLVTCDLIYWVFLGMPIAYLFYHQVMGVALQDTLVVMLKQSVNGISNALLATLVLILVKFVNKQSGDRVAYADLLFSVMLSFSLLPTIMLSVSATRAYQENRMETIKSRVSSISDAAQRSLAGWISEHHKNVQILASLVGDPNRSPFREMQHYTEIMNAATPAFKSMGVFNEKSVSVSYSPLEQDGKSNLGVDMSARAHIAIMKSDKKPYITDVMMSKLGKPTPIVVLLAPIVISGEYKGYCSGVVETSDVAGILANLKERDIDITLVDGRNNVIVSTLPEFSTMTPFVRPYSGATETADAQTLLWKPNAMPNVSVMTRWRNSFMFNAAPLSESCSWKVVIDASLAPVVEDISRYSLTWLAFQGLLIFAAIVLSSLLSKGFLTNVRKLQVLTRSVTQRLDDTEPHRWPISAVEELAELSSNFQQMTSTLLKHLADRKLNEQRITHINRVLDSIRLISKLIIYEKNRRSMLQRACNLLIETRGYRAAWAVLYDDRVKPVVFAESGIGENFKNLLSEMECGVKPKCYSSVLGKGSGVFPIRDIATMCSTCPLVESFRDGSALIGALRHNEREYGVLAVALPAGMVDDENELSLFGELSGDLGYALYSLEQEERRKQAEELYSVLFSTSADGILIADAGTKRFLFANPAICSLLGYREEELLSVDVQAIHPPENLPDIMAEFERQSVGAMAPIPDVPCLRKDGSIVYADVNAVRIRIEGKQCLAGFFRDITTRKLAEEEHNRLEKQLLQAQKMESVGRLAGGVAHDFNNMLNVIIGYTEMALEKVEGNPSLHEDLAEVLTAAGRSAEITRQLLAFARKQTIDPQVLDLNDTIAGMLKMLQRLIGENIDLSWNPKSGLWQIKMDPSQVDQILANLCVNARDAIRDVGRITIKTDNVTLDEFYCADHSECFAGDYVMLSVSDTGCGMDRETQEKIFEPFYTTKELGKGTGLGMSTVYGIVKQNRGSINIYSERETGTIVNIYIPRHISEKQVAIPEQARKASAGKGETLLVVEDEPAVRKMGRMMLEKSGYAVLTAASPSEAFAVAEKQGGKIDLLITDVVMPEMNGKELARKLQDIYPKIKVLFMSGYTADAIARHGVLDDGVNFIQKPFSHRDLIDKVEAALDVRKDNR